MSMSTGDSKITSGQGGFVPKRRGRSSFLLQNPNVVFKTIGLRPGDHFLDIGCGPGEYSLRAAEEVGPQGVVHALDKSGEAVELLAQKAAERGLANIRPGVFDFTSDRLTLNDHSIDACLLATVMHIIGLTKATAGLFNEIKRVLKPGAKVTVINCKKEDGSFGPPMRMRLEAPETEAFITGLGFEKIQYLDLGFNYLLRFIRK